MFGLPYSVSTTYVLLLGFSSTRLLFVSQRLAPAPVRQTESDSESLLFLDLLWSLRLSQRAEQSGALVGSFRRHEDGRQKCRRRVDRNRLRDSREPSSQRTRGHPLPRQPPSESRRSGPARPATVSNSVRVPSNRGREY